MTPLVECPHVKVLIYDTHSEVDADLDVIANEISNLKAGLEGRIKVVSVEELCRIGLEVMENPDLDKPTDKGRIWGQVYARTLNEYELPFPRFETNAQVAAGCK